MQNLREQQRTGTDGGKWWSNLRWCPNDINRSQGIDDDDNDDANDALSVTEGLVPSVDPRSRSTSNLRLPTATENIVMENSRRLQSLQIDEMRFSLLRATTHNICAHCPIHFRITF